ncbi:MAG: hypothetical protein SWO11_13335 [Thermodesulfobacteriota bacterium]|nr:hypothetical protein [Thermodesulfobacteriota bacterium]
MMKTYFAFGLLFVFLLVLSGCGDNLLESISDDDSKEAKLEDGRMALNKGNYDRALSILGKLNPYNLEVAKYVCSAYMGKAGFNTLDLAEKAAELQDEGKEGSFDLVGSLLDDDGMISIDYIVTHIQFAGYALDVLKDLQQAKGELNNELKALLGTAAALHATYTLLEIIQEDLAIDDIPATEEGIETAYEGRIFDTSSISDDELEALNLDMGYMIEAVEAMLEITGAQTQQENDLADNFDEFVNNIDSNRDDQVSRDEIGSYINNMGTEVDFGITEDFKGF